MSAFILAIILNVGLWEAKEERYENALPLLIATETVSSERYAEYWFYRAVTHHQLMQKQEALTALDNLENSFGVNVPLRYRSVAYGMRLDLNSWESKGLENIERLMNSVSRRLNQGYGGEETQRQQKKIVQKLDEMIKQEEARASGQMAKGCPNGGDKPGPQVPNGTNKADKPASESIIMGGKGEGKVVDEKKLREIAQSWGNLPPAQRAKVVQEITRDLPPKFEPMIKNYFEALDKMYGYGKIK